MADAIFVMDAQGKLIPMLPSAYDAEDVLQRLLAQHPELLPLSSGNGPARWLLVAREAAIPDDSGDDRFSLDHLFLDAEGVPTLVEVKRSADSRIRREVVGQMLEYASHFVIHWTEERVRNSYERTCAALGVDPTAQLAALIGDQTDADTFWQRVRTNLLARRIRLLFVADRIPPELRRVVEFLNSVMDPVEVLAVEVPQYTGQGLATFVPRVIGQTAAAEEKKGGGSTVRQPWDEPRFMAALGEKHGPRQVDCARQILAWISAAGHQVGWGRGKTMGSFNPVIETLGDWHPAFAIWTYGGVEIQFQHMRDVQPLGRDGLRREVWARLSRIPGVVIPETDLALRPTIPLSKLAEPDAMKQFLGTWDWYAEEVRKS